MSNAGRPKGSGGVNKSRVIREYLTENPGAATNIVVEALAARGIDVSQALVSGVRSRLGRKSEVTAEDVSLVNAFLDRFEDRSVVTGMVADVVDLTRKLGSADHLLSVLNSLDDSESSEDAEEAETDSEDSDE